MDIENDIKQLIAVLDSLKTRYSENSLDAALCAAVVEFYHTQNMGGKRLSRIHDLLGTKIKVNTQKNNIESIIKNAVKEAILVGDAGEIIPELQYAALTLVMTLVDTFTKTNQLELAEKIKKAFKESSLKLATMLENDSLEVLH
ncbi:hypothetical protein [Pasteurella multocida]|uniref:hypothetical protein n=1 Tax=Pasteurella multocida TaxID=747 RepID=UPI00027B20A1|nr:hypothetical protein [Pasteurella multocida]APB80189.1 hypothetical protein BMF22_09205 [Pasteurella multocida]EJS83419.1 hypothetical protein KCU_10673 [Pasteurella multocida subsp. multocida str. P52VAC]KEP93664.1 hypothetical protein UQU_0205325 [Pasteurella multocida subsp. multocida VTCCBAA264]KLT47946.1 hypothetical protein PVACC_05230 [Pasteurella multocida subsp. multocida]KLT50698.1 hypothetical protein PMTX1_05045 [Pasteurella multocida subsp. multocida]